MYKNQLQELAQRSCFNLPAYSCIREGPDHAPRFKATVNFNGEVFESPNYCTTLRQAEHSAAELALCTLSRRGPSQALAARILDETGVFKNLLQETAQRANVPLPMYTTTRSGPGHLPVFTCVVEVAAMSFTGEVAKTKKQAEKNAAMAAWSTLKQFARKVAPPMLPLTDDLTEDQEQISIARVLYMAYEKVSKGRPSGQYMGGSWANKECSSEAAAQMRYLTNHQQQQQQQQHLRSGNAFSSMSNRSPDVLLRDVRGSSSSTLVTPHSRMMRTITPRNVQLHEVPTPVEEHLRDEEEWLRGGDSRPGAASAAADEAAAAQARNNCRSPMFWSRSANSQWWEPSDSSILPRYRLRPGASLAPPVRVRSVVAVSAAPPQRSQPREASAESDCSSDGLSNGLSRQNI